MTEIELQIQECLFSLQDPVYRDFQAKLLPTVPYESIIGVRTPALKEYARELSGTPEAENFLSLLPHRLYEENNLHGFLIARIKDYRQCIAAVDAFLPYVDNWATCDLIRPKVFAKHTDELIEKIREWLASGRAYMVRFGIEMLMTFYLEDKFDPSYPELVAGVDCREYYVSMMVAWYFATALAKQYTAVLPYLENTRLDPQTHNRTIRKACESLRIGAEQKAYLKTLRH